MLYRCFKAINTLSLAFQAVEIDIVRAQDYYKIAHGELVNMKFDNEFDEFYNTLTTTARNNNIEFESNSNNNKRSRKEAKQPQLSSKDNKAKFKILHDELINVFLEELDARFTDESIKPVVAIYNIITADSSDHLDFKDISIYKDDVDFDALKMELKVWYSFKTLYPTQFETTKMIPVNNS